MSANCLRLVAVTAVLLVAASAVGRSSVGSKGTMPPPGPNGQLDGSLAPDFIAVAGRDGGIAGYVPKAYLFPTPTTTIERPMEPDIPVYADDLRTLIGHMVPGKGFVPLGVDPAAVSTIPVRQGPALASPAGESGSLTLYVRSATPRATWFAVVSPGEAVGAGAIGAQGYNTIGVGCLDVAAGSQLVMVDRPPQDAGATILGVIYQAAGANDNPTLWVDMGADGTASHGVGVPSWWSGPPQVC
jgi:hypothetical protein